MQEAGALSKTFTDDSTLRFEIDLLLDRLARVFSNPKNIKDGDLIRVINNLTTFNSGETDGEKSEEYDDEIDEELGSFDISEGITKKSEEVVIFALNMSKHMNELTEVINSSTEKIAAITGIRRIDSVEGKSILWTLTSEMDRFSEFIENELPNYRESFGDLLGLLRNCIDISYDCIGESGGEFGATVFPLHASVEELKIQVSSARDSTFEFLTSVKKLQRMTSSFNRAKRRFSLNISAYISDMDSNLIIMDKALDEFVTLMNTASNANDSVA